jgi:hypothetical protein
MDPFAMLLAKHERFGWSRRREHLVAISLEDSLDEVSQLLLVLREENRLGPAT